MRTPKGFRNISTSFQAVFATLDGDVEVRRIGARLWQYQARGKGAPHYAKSLDEAVNRGLLLARPIGQKRRS